MLRLRSERRDPLSRLAGEDWRGRLAELEESVGPPPKRLVVGIIAVVVLAWGVYAFGPELRRYLKMRSM